MSGCSLPGVVFGARAERDELHLGFVEDVVDDVLGVLDVYRPDEEGLHGKAPLRMAGESELHRFDRLVGHPRIGLGPVQLALEPEALDDDRKLATISSASFLPYSISAGVGGRGWPRRAVE